MYLHLNHAPLEPIRVQLVYDQSMIVHHVILDIIVMEEGSLNHEGYVILGIIAQVDHTPQLLTHRVHLLLRIHLLLEDYVQQVCNCLFEVFYCL